MRFVADKFVLAIGEDTRPTLYSGFLLSFSLLLANWGAFKLVQVFPENLEYQGLSGLRSLNYVISRLHSVTIFGIPINYLLNVDANSLSKHYPNFGPVFVLAREIVKYVILIVFCASPFLIWRNRNSALLLKLRQRLRFLVQSNVFGVSMMLWLTALLVYFLFRAHSPQPVIFQLLATKLFLSVWLLFLVVNLLQHQKKVFGLLTTFFNDPVSPYNLAIIRFLFFGYLALMQFNYSHHFGPNMGELDKVGLPFIGWLIDIIPVTPQLYKTIAYIGCVASILAMVGFKTRLAMLVNTITIFYVIATPNFFGKLWHTHIFIWITWILAVSPCYDVLSVDARMKSEKPTNSNYGFHLKIIWLHFGLIYGFAGFYKLWLCGFDWALSDSMINQVRLEWFEHFDRIPELRIDKLPWLLKIGGFGVILFELAYFFLVFKTKTRYLAATLGIVMHNAIGYFMYISFFWALQVFYVVFVPWDKVLSLFNKNTVDVKEISSHSLNFKSWKVITPLVILAANFTCGVFNVNSYPFSIYPVYAELVDEDVKYFHFKPKLMGGKNLDVRELAAESNYRWESFTRIEYAIIKEFEQTGVLDTNDVKTAWRRWEIGVPDVKNAKSVDVHLVNRFLEPEKAESPLSDVYLFSFQPE